MEGIVASSGQARALRRKLQEAQRRDKALRGMTSRLCEVLLVRHGETAWNESGRLQGQLSPGPPLNLRGQEQAAALAGWLRSRGQHIDRVYSSDLSRAMETAEAIRAAVGGSVSVDRDLRERALGSALEGQGLEAARELEPAAYEALVSHSTTLRLPVRAGRKGGRKGGGTANGCAVALRGSFCCSLLTGRRREHRRPAPAGSLGAGSDRCAAPGAAGGGGHSRGVPARGLSQGDGVLLPRKDRQLLFGRGEDRSSRDPAEQAGHLGAHELG